MAELPTLLLASLNPSSRKQAEQSLQSLSVQPGFLTHLLTLVLQGAQDRAVRLAASVYLKNIVKSRWEDVRTRWMPADLCMIMLTDASLCRTSHPYRRQTGLPSAMHLFRL